MSYLTFRLICRVRFLGYVYSICVYYIWILDVVTWLRLWSIILGYTKLEVTMKINLTCEHLNLVRLLEDFNVLKVTNVECISSIHFSVFRQIDQKQKNQLPCLFTFFSTPQISVLTENFFLYWPIRNLLSQQKVNKQDSWFFCFWSLWPNNKKTKMNWWDTLNISLI